MDGRAQEARQHAGKLTPEARARRYTRGRRVRGGGSQAQALAAARREHAAMPRFEASRAMPLSTPNLTAAWVSVGPAQLMNPEFGNVTGRVTAITIDPADASGNTVYVGTTGGGVWKSTNAAGPAAAVSFVPLTDTLPVFDLSAGSSATPSLSIGALAVGGGVLLAGTGDPDEATDSYYGGGILRSADGGLTWTLIVQATNGTGGVCSFVGSGVAALAFSTADPQLVVAAISDAAEGAEVNAGTDAIAFKGLYVSQDAGMTWEYATVMDGAAYVQAPNGGAAAPGAATSVVWNAARGMFFAAVRYHGYYGSADGLNWTRLANQPGAGITLAACPTESLQSGCPVFRGELAVQAVTGDTFALTVDGGNEDQGLFQDMCGVTAAGTCGNAVAFGTQLDSAPLEVGSGSTEIVQADYDLALAAVDSGMDTLLYAGAVDLYRCSLAAGCVLRDTTNAVNGCATPAGVAPDQHAIAAVGPLMFFGNDGGIWRTTDGVAETGGVCSAGDASHFENLNGGIGSLAEVVDFDEDPVSATTLLAGLGALGTAATGTASGAWGQMSTGEGGTVAIDASNPLNWYVATGAGVNIATCGNGAACRMSDFATAAIGAAQVDGDDAEVDAPWMLDPAATGEMLVGTCRVWRGPAEGSVAWMGGDRLSAPFAASAASGCGSTFAVVQSLAAGGAVSAPAAAPNEGSEVVYAGMAGAFGATDTIGGHVFGTQAGNTASGATAWNDLAASPVINDAGDDGVFNPGSFAISSLAVDPHDATGATVYATVMGFAGNGFNAPHVYRSVDGGAHWTNISRNLPNAPANGVVVDPNDANTVYVALDTGVYVTTAVTSCTSAQCWSVYGSGLPNAPVTKLAMAAGMATGDGRTGELRAGTYGRGIWEIPLVTAAFPAAPAITLSPTAVTFSSQQVGTESASVTLTVTNSGNATLTVTNIAVSGDFSESDTCSGTSVAAGGKCSVSVEFLPTVVGTRDGVLTVYGNVASGQATAMLGGVGTAPASIVLTPGALSFAATLVGSTATAQNVTISNTGGTAASLSSEMVSGDFSISANTCGSSLAAGAGCTVSVGFSPTVSGSRTGTLTIVDGLGTQVASLSGSGLSAATDGLGPLSLSFGGQELGTASAAQQVALSNTGDPALTSIALQVSGDFTLVTGCGGSLAGHTNCSLSVSYVPKSVGSEVGVLTVSDALRTQTVALSGTGIAPAGVSLSPAGGLPFAATPIGQMAAAQAVTLTNNGGSALILSGVSVTGDFVVGTNACGASLAASTSCTVQVSFAPTAGGNRTGTLAFADNASGSPQSLALSGVGVDFTLGADGPATMTVASGQTATYLVLLSAAAGVPGSAAFACSGEPKTTTCLLSPGTAVLDAAGGTVVTVTIATGVATGDLRMPWERQMVWLAVLLPLARGMRRRRGLMVLLVGLAMMCGSGCTTVGRTIPPSGLGGGGSPPVTTPNGSYLIVVTGTSAGLARTVDLTLVVQ